MENSTNFRESYLAGNIRKRTRVAMMEKHIDTWNGIEVDKPELHVYLGLTINEFFIYRMDSLAFFNYLDKMEKRTSVKTDTKAIL